MAGNVCFCSTEEGWRLCPPSLCEIDHKHEAPVDDSAPEFHGAAGSATSVYINKMKHAVSIYLRHHKYCQTSIGGFNCSCGLNDVRKEYSV